MQGQEHLPVALTADDGVHFSHPGVRAFPDECLVGAPLKDSGVRDFGGMRPARLGNAYDFMVLCAEEIRR